LRSWRSPSAPPKPLNGPLPAVSTPPKKRQAFGDRSRQHLGKLVHEKREAARAARRGLWQDKTPIPPWEWRREFSRTQFCLDQARLIDTVIAGA